MSLGGDKKDDGKSLLREDFLSQLIHVGKKIVIVVLKNKTNLTKVQTIINRELNKTDPVLIIDDEGDEATPNTKEYQDLQSSTYSEVVSLMHCTGRTGFISVTATPQANYLIRNDDELSPKFGILIQPGDGYCGLNVFHSDNSNYVRDISEDEDLEDTSSDVPISFKEALSSFFVGAAIRRYKGDDDKHAMLIHTSSSKNSHNVVAKRVNQILKSWVSLCEPKLLDDFENDSYSELDKLFHNSYIDFQKTCSHLPAYSELERYILDAVVNCQRNCLICNGDVDQSSDVKYFPNNIIVGGNKLQRGITIKGLSVTYMTRRAIKTSNVDTTEQRARWFGYRMKHLHVIRLFLTNDIINDFINIRRHEENFWTHLSGWLNEGYEFADIPRILTLPDCGLIPTRRSVAKTIRLSISGDWATQNYVVLDDTVSRHNIELAEQFFLSHVPVIEDLGSNKHEVSYNVHINDLCDNFLSKLIYPDKGKFNLQRVNLIKKALVDNQTNPFVDVIWMRQRNPQGRTIQSDGKINELFMGSNANYLGDRYFHPNLKNPRNTKIQIHYITPLNTDRPYSTVIAVAFNFSRTCLDKINRDILVRMSDLNEM